VTLGLIANNRANSLTMLARHDEAEGLFDTVLDAARRKAKVVLTSRTQHFQSDQQITELGTRARQAGGRIAVLSGFNEEQIGAYLHNRCDSEREAIERFERIREIKDLLGLSHNPRMLAFIAGLPASDLRAAKDRDGDIRGAIPQSCRTRANERDGARP